MQFGLTAPSAVDAAVPVNGVLLPPQAKVYIYSVFFVFLYLCFIILTNVNWFNPCFNDLFLSGW